MFDISFVMIHVSVFGVSARFMTHGIRVIYDISHITYIRTSKYLKTLTFHQLLKRSFYHLFGWILIGSSFIEVESTADVSSSFFDGSLYLLHLSAQWVSLETSGVLLLLHLLYEPFGLGW